MPILANPTGPTKGKSKSRPADTCRLTLHIRGVAYAVTPLRADRGAGCRKLYRLRKADGTAYHVARLDAGHTHCDCPDFEFRREGLDKLGCKHIKSLRATGLL